MATMVKPEILPAFNGQVQAASTQITAEDTGAKVRTAADELDGSATRWACQMVSIHIGEVEKVIATNLSQEGVAVRVVGDKFEVTDQDLTGKFNGLFT